jgi:hypothetical protein
MLLILLIPAAKNIIALAWNQTNEPGMTLIQPINVIPTTPLHLTIS